MARRLSRSEKYDKSKFDNLSLSTLKKRRKDALHNWSEQIFSKAGKPMTEEERRIWLDEGRSWQNIVDALNLEIKVKTPYKYQSGTIGYWKKHGGKV